MGPTKPVVSNSTTSSSTMEVPLPPPPSCTASPPSSAIQAPLVAPPPQPPHLNYPDSVDSSPRSRNMDSWDESCAPTAAATTTTNKLRFMCSYGGHIVPRPHDKSLCYLGGVTRMIVIDRQSSLSVLSSRLSSEALLDGRPFMLKYQLPSEDLDSLISITSDEDLDNMIDEYDRLNTANPSVKPSRIRLFLFAVKSKTSHSVGPILDSSAKSEDWFWNALNSTGVFNRGLSDSASANCLLSLDDDIVRKNVDSGSRNVEVGQVGSFVNVKNVKQGRDVHSVPDSPMLDTTSSFGSTSSSPSLANLPPIRVHMNNGNVSSGGFRVHDQKVGIEEQLARMSVCVGQGVLKQDEDFTALSSPPSVAVAGLSGVPGNVAVTVNGGEHQNQVFSDDERSDNGLPVGYRKPTPPPQMQQQPQTQLQPQPQPQPLPLQSQQKVSGGMDLLSPDSVSSDNSFTNAMSRTKPSMYQDPFQVQSGSTRLPSNSVDPKLDMSDPNARVQMQQQFQDSGYLLQPQYEQYQQETQQQKSLSHDKHYIQHLPPGSVPIQAYYPVHPSQHQSHPHHLDQQYEALYYWHARQAQAYNLSVQQPNNSEPATGFPPNRQNPPNPAVVLQPSSFNHLRNIPISKPEVVAAIYRTPAAGTQQLVQVPFSQHQQQYVGYSQIHPSQSVAPTSVASANYSYELSNPVHSKQQYTQTMPPTMRQ